MTIEHLDIVGRLERIEAALSVLIEQRTLKDWYTTGEVAKILGKAEFTVRERCRNGRIRVLPFYVQPIVGDPELEISMPVALWKSSTNHCERSGSRRDDSAGHYYSLGGMPSPGGARTTGTKPVSPPAPLPHPRYDREQYRKECHDQKTRILQEWQTVPGRIESAASILSHAGLEQEAERLWQVHD